MKDFPQKISGSFELNKNNTTHTKICGLQIKH